MKNYKIKPALLDPRAHSNKTGFTFRIFFQHLGKYDAIRNFQYGCKPVLIKQIVTKALIALTIADNQPFDCMSFVLKFLTMHDNEFCQFRTKTFPYSYYSYRA